MTCGAALDGGLPRSFVSVSEGFGAFVVFGGFVVVGGVLKDVLGEADPVLSVSLGTVTKQSFS